ncbi:TonB-dependent receptor domain-containing protein [Aquimarina sp. Aq107]|uniref:TonB-dependent receptor domain-containing protein n=1 Tax=Aquimarina sp. Aq107 TaxID=1191912 RepID=UPI000D562D51|nr:outer membrane beta-barrel family protein [Aquimarina sp. Aq107]
MIIKKKSWKIVINFIVLFLPLITFCQYKVNGTIKDSNGTIPFANILVKSTSNNLVTGAITDKAGTFTIDLNQGLYTLTISHVGYQNLEKQIEINSDLDLGELSLVFDNELDEVLIVKNKERIVQKVDRLVFNNENNGMTSGGTGLDVLRVAPGVTISDDQLVMIGKSGMRLMVDGKLVPLSGNDLVSYISSISADDVKEVEIITNPPAKYQAEGNSGLINIIYKRNTEKIWNNRINLSYTQAKYAIYNLNNNFSYNKNKVKLLLGVNATLGDNEVQRNTEINYDRGLWELDRVDKWREDKLATRLMIDYSISDKTTMGVQYLNSLWVPDIDIRNVNNVFEGSQLDSIYKGSTNYDVYGAYNAANLNFTHKLDTLGRKISIDLDFFRNKKNEEIDVLTTSFNSDGVRINDVFSNLNISNEDLKNYSGRIDVEYPLSTVNLSFGGRINHSESLYKIDNFNTLSGNNVLNPQFGDDFKYLETQQAVYINATKKLGKKVDMQLGLRLENTETEGISFIEDTVNEFDYLRLFPTFYISYKKDKKNTFSFNYGRRIRRPLYYELSPVRRYYTNTFFVDGNPLLRPSFSDNMELSYSHKRKFFSRAFLSIESDGFGEVAIINENSDEQANSIENYYTLYNYGINTYYIFNKLNWLESQNGFYILGSDVKFEREINTRTQQGLRFYFETNNTLHLNPKKTIRAQVNYSYSSPYNKNQFEYAERHKLDLSFQFQLLNKSLQLTAGAFDILRLNELGKTSFVNDIRQSSRVYMRDRSVRLSLMYKFGNKKIKVRERKFGNEEEKRRSGN